MKIFISFLQSNHKHPIPAYDFWEYYIKNGIVEAGHEWVECPDIDWAAGLVPQSKNELAMWKQDAWTKTVAWLKGNPADLFLSYLYPKQIDVTAIKQIQKMGIPCVNFFCDNIREFNKPPIQFKAFDLNWVPEYKAIKLYKQAGYPHIYLPMPMWIEPAYRVHKEEANNQVTFIGSRDIQRVRLFNELVNNNPEIQLAIYGNGWLNNTSHKVINANYTLAKKILFNISFLTGNGIKGYARKMTQLKNQAIVIDTLKLKLHELISDDEYVALTSASMITLGVNRYPSYKFPLAKPDTYSRLRDIEAPMLGACYLTEWTEGIEDLYDTQNEIAVYRTGQELADQINSLQNDPERRRALRRNGQEKALRMHSIPRSLNSITKALGLQN
ncbi:glycosyltransferase [Mucilaginibacter sp.]|jgi:glycosyltransferase involved in cell wall biosynthesis|uniref:glycosyltransferase family protein n=1 Tax=Mucilaginibacter sp. TaxID=1882438 RepID=UPI0035628408